MKNQWNTRHLTSYSEDYSKASRTDAWQMKCDIAYLVHIVTHDDDTLALKASYIHKILAIGERTVERHLADLIEMEILTRHKVGRETVYTCDQEQYSRFKATVAIEFHVFMVNGQLFVHNMVKLLDDFFSSHDTEKILAYDRNKLIISRIFEYGTP